MAKILDIIPYKIIPAESGGQKAIYLFCKYLARQHKLTTISVKSNNSDDAFYMLCWFGNSVFRYINPAYYFSIKKYIKAGKITTLIIEHPYMAWLGFLLKKSLNIKWIIRTHNIEAQRFKSLRKWWWFMLKHYERWAFKNAGAILFITDDDMEFAVSQYKIKNSKCFVMPYGVELTAPPPENEIAKKQLHLKHNIPVNNKLILFNGMFNYQPNLDALSFTVNELNNALQQTPLAYSIIICGKHIPEHLINTTKNKQQIITVGFVENINEYYRAADVFINPITDGGGVKTKMIEALANNITVVSCVSGAKGVDEKVCGKKLYVVPDSNAEAFSEAINKAVNIKTNTPPAFYQVHAWPAVITQLRSVFE